MDEYSVFFFEKHLSSIYNECEWFTKTHLLVVVDQFFKMMEDGLCSLSKLKVILLHLLQINDGNEEVVLESVCKFWLISLAKWLPVHQHLKVCKTISDFLINKAFVSLNPTIKDFCITKLANFVKDLQNVKLVAFWILKSNREIMMPSDLGEQDEDLAYDEDKFVPMEMKMTLHQEYYLTKTICASPYLSLEEREDIINTIFKVGDKSDSTIRFRQISQLRFPDRATKLKVWNQLTNLNLAVNFTLYRNLSQSFISSPLDYEQIKDLLDNYYELMPKMMEDHKFGE